MQWFDELLVELIMGLGHSEMRQKIWIGFLTPISLVSPFRGYCDSGDP